MKITNLFIFSAVALAIPIFILQGCGGGGGGGSSPTPTSTPTAGARTLIVQLRDSAGNTVDGIVTVGNIVTAGNQIKATVDGQASFTRVLSGNIDVTAEVNGVKTIKAVNIAANGTTTLIITIPSGLTPGPTTAPPPPPFE